MADSNFKLPAGGTNSVPSNGAKPTPTQLGGSAADKAEDAASAKTAAVPYT